MKRRHKDKCTLKLFPHHLGIWSNFVPVPFGKPQLHRLPTTSSGSNMSSDQDNNLGCDHLVVLEKSISLSKKGGKLLKKKGNAFLKQSIFVCSNCAFC